ncbi:ribonucleotide-diphosphate reductase subunit beta [Priestia megaterium]|uniref:ribonucleotide-diphosphate reductase subunit beta n=1 Tax=Priestia megaterium TaxID=1404 RepID=UPI003CC61F88
MNKRLQRVKLLQPTNPNKATLIVGGLASGILNWDDIKYAQTHDDYKKLLANRWTPFEVNMTDDAKKYPTLGRRTQDAFENIISLLASLDSIQPNLLGAIAPYITDTSFKALISTIAADEVVHNYSYSYVLSSIVNKSKQDKVFENARMNPKILKRNKVVFDLYDEFVANPTILNLVRALVGVVVLEGINFYSGFAFFYNLARNKLMTGTAVMIEYIQRDEKSHLKIGGQLLRGILAENPEIDKDGSFSDFVYETIQKAVEEEIEWSRYALRDIEGIDLEEMEEYIQYIGNKRLNMLGLEHIYDVDDNPMPWIKAYSDEEINLTHTDFFEQKSRLYAKTTDTNGFDDL